MIALTMLGALGGALELARNAAIVAVLWCCAIVLTAPLLGMWLRRSRERMEDQDGEGR